MLISELLELLSSVPSPSTFRELNLNLSCALPRLPPFDFRLVSASSRMSASGSLVAKLLFTPILVSFCLWTSLRRSAAWSD